MFQYRYIVRNGSETGVLDRKETQKERGARVTGGAKEAERALAELKEAGETEPRLVARYRRLVARL